MTTSEVKTAPDLCRYDIRERFYDPVITHSTLTWGFAGVVRTLTE